MELGSAQKLGRFRSAKKALADLSAQSTRSPAARVALQRCPILPGSDLKLKTQQKNSSLQNPKNEQTNPIPKWCTLKWPQVVHFEVAGDTRSYKGHH